MPAERLRREGDSGSVGLYYSGNVPDRRDGRPIGTWRLECMDNFTGQYSGHWQASRAAFEMLHDVLTEFLGRGGPSMQVVEVRVTHTAPSAPIEAAPAVPPDPARAEMDAIKDEMRRRP